MPDMKWWQSAVFYQIYPRSFADGNGDGIGDLPGASARLDYLEDLGIDAIWLSPHYPSPLCDCGYDVSDYRAVAAEYGTLDDFIQFLEGAHKRGIRVILDLVLNHTSDQHAWFLESRSSRSNARRDWYIWRDGVAGGPPNNWNGTFGGSAWEYDPLTSQYYYHFFYKEQPDLNWRNPEVKQAMFDVARFWLDLGVDGFRLDAIDTIFEDPGLSNHASRLGEVELYRMARAVESEEDWRRWGQEWEAMFGSQVNQAGLHELMQELRAIIDEYEDRVLVGETDNVNYYGTGTDELHMVFNFPLMRTPLLTPAWVRANQRERLSAIPAGGWSCNALGNHDSPRVFNRYGDGRNDFELARLSLALLLTLRGAPFLYNGEEIGMTDLLLQDLAQFRDPVANWHYQMEASAGTAPEKALEIAAQLSRDKCRTPLQWSDAPNAGFSPPGVKTWLPVNPNYAEGINVSAQDPESASLLNFYRRLIHTRRQYPALVAGDYQPVHTSSQDYLAFLRQSPANDQTCLVLLNFAPGRRQVRLDLPFRRLLNIFSTHQRDQHQELPGNLEIQPFEIYLGLAVP